MPTIEVSLRDLSSIARVDLTPDGLRDIVEVFKGEVTDVKGDYVAIELNYDRPDLFSAEGLGRAIGIYLGSRSIPEYNVDGPATKLDATKAPAYRPYAYMAIVRNVELNDEAIRQLFQLQEILHRDYGDDRRLVSIGLYDLDTVKPPFSYVTVKEATYRPLGYSESMTLTDVLNVTEKGKAYSSLVKPGEYPLLIDDEGKVLSFPPILNGEETKVTEATRNVLIDVTGVEPELMKRVLNIMVTSVAERSRNPVIQSIEATGANSELTPSLNWININVKLKDAEDLIGMRLEPNATTSVLMRMGFKVSDMGDSINVLAPPYRIDVHSYVDVIEDIAIGLGYNNLEPNLPPPTHFGSKHPVEHLSSIIRDLLLGMGLQEVVNFNLISDEVMRSIGLINFVKLSNPKIKDYSALRSSLIPSLLLTVKVNQRLVGKLEAFEIGDVVELKDNTAATSRRVGVLLMGDGYTLTDGLSVVKSLLKALGMAANLRKCGDKPFIPVRAVEVLVNDSRIGCIGEVDPEVLVNLGIEKPTVIGELNIDLMLSILKSLH
ncbi:phenylalanine--tRNA ligase subunit beta [Caldivirga sp. UBA161]|uniref:phenylalanine--tRNA ligase subunit beta n=1 Tax=Caldivirga sp. UBA161 TaxID=1915569 RepID=UPI0025C64244|nr:phenylalanine--tRNA ligase subunit beta [Caldivirga sp. UBA161]